MEQTDLNESVQTPERQRQEPSPKFTLRLPAFLSQIGSDVRWYFDVRLWLPVILVLLVLSMCTANRTATNKTTEKYEAMIQTVKDEAQAELEKVKAEAEKAAQVTTPPPVINPEAEALAILADAVGAGRSNNVKIVIMWLAINRSENAIEGHGKSLLEEIDMPLQWQGYDPEKTYSYSQTTYDLAVDVLETWASGGLRPIDRDMMWLVLNNDGSVTIRNKYQGKNWNEKTIR